MVLSVGPDRGLADPLQTHGRKAVRLFFV